MRRAIAIVTGLLLAGLASLITLAIGFVVESLSLDATTAAAIVKTLSLALAMVGLDPSGLALSAEFHLLWLAVVVACWGPVTLAAVVGEAAGGRSVLAVCVLSGCSALVLPLVALHHASAALTGRLVEHGLIILFLSGVAGGLVYGLVASRPRSA